MPWNRNIKSLLSVQNFLTRALIAASHNLPFFAGYTPADLKCTKYAKGFVLRREKVDFVLI